MSLGSQPIVHLVHVGLGIGLDLAQIRSRAGRPDVDSRLMGRCEAASCRSNVHDVDVWHEGRSDSGDDVILRDVLHRVAVFRRGGEARAASAKRGLPALADRLFQPPTG